MTFYEVLEQVIALLQRHGRVTYRALKRHFDLDDDYLDDLKAELIEARQLAVDEAGKVLVWTGEAAVTRVPGPTPLPPVDSPETQPASPRRIASLVSEPRAPEAERRQLTVLFCDLVDSTRLARQLDPEDLREVIRTYQAACVAVIQRFAGHVAQYLGDGLLVYFGYPQAHEDDAQRAVRTGLGIPEAMGTLHTPLMRGKSIRLAVRIGIHTGLVVVGEMGSGGRYEHLALGDTPNLAARLQGLAEPNTVVISDVTSRLVQGYFTCQDRGTHALKGLDMPVHIFQVLGESAAQSRLDVAATRGLTPLVGREEEVGLLLRRWAQSQDGLGQVVLLSGEAGIGKSRLVQVVKDCIADTPHTRLECRCSPYYQNTALYPIIDLLERVLHFQRDEILGAKLEKLERALSQYRFALHETVPLFATLLSLPLPEARYAPLSLTPERQKQKTLEALLAAVLEMAERQPVLFILEDLHWVDPSTLEFLHLLIAQGPTAAILTVMTYRPDFQPPWGWRTHLTPLALQRLTPADVAAMVMQMTGGKPLPTEVLQHVVTNTDGVPLFVEELTKTILESGILRETEAHYELTGPLPTLAIPTTLHDALMARLDRLSTVKAVAQLGATLGRTFAYDLLQAVTPFDAAMLQQGLRQLVEAEILYQRGLPPRATYHFKHALLQEAAYQSLLKRTRQQYHQRIAQVLEAQFPETVATQPELLAHHYTEAGLGAPALAYWQHAGQRALERSAHVEAINHLTQGLEVLKGLPNTPERPQQELGLQLTLGIPLSATRGYAAPEVAHVYTRAQELCQRLGETPQLIPALLGLWRFYLLRAELGKARELAEQCLLLVQRVDDPARLIVAHDALGETMFFLGDFAHARAHLERAVAFYDPQKRQPHRALMDPGVSSLSMLAGTLWMLGYPEQARQKITEALRLAETLAQPHILASTLVIATHLHQLRREVRTTHTQAEAVMALATEQGFPFWLAEATIFLGWALAAQGRGAEGTAQIQHGLATRQAIGLELTQPVFLTLLAEAYERVEQPTAGLTVLTDALTRVDTTGERWREADLDRLRGELLLAVSVANCREAEACFRQALEVARQQQAKSWELRAAMSLSRLWQRQGKRDEARQLLAPIYGWFTEGFDTADLQEAKALLEALA
jgi:class 3 adenylate cyclase/predicted ATPase